MIEIIQALIRAFFEWWFKQWTKKPVVDATTQGEGTIISSGETPSLSRPTHQEPSLDIPVPLPAEYITDTDGVEKVEIESIPEKQEVEKIDVSIDYRVRAFQRYFKKNGIKENVKSFQLNICAIHKSYNITNKFDDEFVIWRYNDDGKIEYIFADCTTKAGITYSRDIDFSLVDETKNDPEFNLLKTKSRELLNDDGVAIVAQGYHENVWYKAHHKGLPALRQCGTFKGYRDKNRDLRFDTVNLIDLQPECFINCHRSSDNDDDLKDIFSWSAGCQVWEKISDFNKFWSWVEKDAHSKKFSYCLLDAYTVEKLQE